MANKVHTPENVTLRGRVTINGIERLLFYVPSSDPDAQPYLFGCGPNGEAPCCECSIRHPQKRGVVCEIVNHAAEIAAKVAVNG